MSGHSKWSKVKHQKALTDTAKGSAFTKASRAITVAVHEGGGITDPNGNFRLRLAIEGARAVNMPKETIQRAIDKGRGAGEGAIEQVIYEAYGPGGVGMLIEAATDNRNRTVSVIKNVFERFGGSLASPGAVSFLFTRSGTTMKPLTVMDLSPEQRTRIDALVAELEALDDVQRVYTNV
ncbi:YebC/PmpR family DNA-binding transcriptional regulator [Candidatus Gottesmanbacteria bacterium]|nr:YebC/PmpR family DNA-binding transcriptional regulator [Candidatus Gottesmanbacteria bacterium]